MYTSSQDVIQSAMCFAKKKKKTSKFQSWCSWNLFIYQHMHILYVCLPVLSQKPCCYLWQRLLRKSPLHGNKCAHFFACHWHNLLHMENLWKTKGYKNFTGLKLLILIFKEKVLLPFSKLINTNPFRIHSALQSNDNSYSVLSLN